MSLRIRIENDMRTAMKARETFKLNVLRFILAQVKNKEIDARRPLTDDELMKVLHGLVKQRTEGLEVAEKAGRADLAEKERGELTILEGYLPKPLTDEEIAAAVDAVIKETGASGMKEMGAVMKAVMARLGGAVDGGRINPIVKGRLSN